jgi:hypothetical protein
VKSNVFISNFFGLKFNNCRFDGVEAKLKATADEFDNARKEAKAAKDSFNEVKQKRYQLLFFVPPFL